MSSASELAVAREETRESWSRRCMIRETVETLGPSGILPSREAVLRRYGPEPVDEVRAITAAIQALVRRG